jgi:filamentous hemagglutinin family protein
MADLIRRYALMGLVVCAIAVSPQVVQAQVIPDGSLPTLVGSPNGLDFAIEGGSRSGNNLFHSFSQFSLPGGSAVFNNISDIQNIFSRVTGGTASNIDGLIQANGAANLFLLNPSGILFGPNAKLNIGGSFIGTTANSVQFANGVEFIVTTPLPLLTMSAPIGLQMAPNPGPITVIGTGHTLTSSSLLFSPWIPTGLNPGLSVSPGKTLALVGGAIDLDGGVLTAPSGHLEVGAVQGGTVQLAINPQGFALSYLQNSVFGDIKLANRSLLDANLLTPGSIQVQGRNISLSGGSSIWLQNRGGESSGSIRIAARDRLSLTGVSGDYQILTSIIAETVGPGAAGPIEVAVGQLLLDGGSLLNTRTFGEAGDGSNLNIQARDIIVRGYLELAPDLYSRLGNATFGRGRAGDLNLTADSLTVLNGGYVGATSVGSGRGGDVLVNAKQIDLSGFTPVLIPSALVSTTVGLGGDAGDLTINTERLTLSNQGIVTTSSLGRGSAGNIVINAKESIVLSSGAKPGQYGSSISSTVDYPTLIYSQIFGLSRIAQGSSGNVTVTTPRLDISDGAGLGSANHAIGNGGKVQVIADVINLNRSDIGASALNGDGGNLSIQTGLLKLRNGSILRADAGNLGNGGNIEINAPVILGLEDSDIIANAVKGRGGNVQITTEGILGLKYRDRLTAENDITASSEFGVNGTVQVDTIGIDPNSGLTVLPVDTVDPSQKIATGCTNQTTSSFVVTGRGGIPENPMQSLNGDRVWRDLRDVAETANPGKLAASIAPAPLVEATAWQVNSQGQPELIDQGLSLGSNSDRISCAK